MVWQLGPAWHPVIVTRRNPGSCDLKSELSVNREPPERFMKLPEGPSLAGEISTLPSPLIMEVDTPLLVENSLPSGQNVHFHDCWREGNIVSPHFSHLRCWKH